MKLVGITGSIGCGKTTLAKIVKWLGYSVFDIDSWVRKIYHNKDFLSKLDNLFPNSVVKGVADKRYLRNIVFSDKNKLESLEIKEREVTLCVKPFELVTLMVK